jgi:hypothetical protein
MFLVQRRLRILKDGLEWFKQEEEGERYASQIT